MAHERIKEIVKISVKNIILNFVLSCVKIIAGLLANSLAVLSDGLNSLSDVATTVAVMISSHFANTSEDKEHQYGHEKIESVTTMIIALFLGAVAVYTIYESFARLVQRQRVNFSYFALGATILSAAVKFYMWRSTARKAKELNSDSLSLVAVDFRFDVILSCSVFTGVLLAMLGFWFFEAAAAIFASVLLLVSAWGFVTKSFRQLIDTAADDDTVELISRMVEACPGVLSIDLLMTRLHGSFLYVDIEISVDSEITVREGHLIAQCVHDRVEGEVDYKIKHCNVHINPYQDI